MVLNAFSTLAFLPGFQRKKESRLPNGVEIR